MSKDDGIHFLDRLMTISLQAERAADRKTNAADDLRPYINQNLWPGKNYLLAGHSYFSHYRIIGTSLETQRAGYLSVLYERGDRCRCVSLGDALSEDGFQEILDEDELQWLSSLPIDTLIGPAFDNQGNRIRAAFAIWRSIEEDAPVHLEIAHK